MSSGPKRALPRFLLLLCLAAGIGACFYFMRQIGPDAAPLYRYGLRILIVALALTAWFTSQSLIASRGLKDGQIGDGIHEITAPLHDYLLAHPRAADRLLIISSVFIDLFGLFLIAVSIFGPGMRPFLALLILFIMRQACQGLCALPVPRQMIWRHPGFPSLLVTYGTDNDFFFSGHTAIATLGAIEIARMGYWWLAVVAAVIAFCEGATVLVLRAHYTIDVFTAVVAAFCAAGLAGWICGVC